MFKGSLLSRLIDTKINMSSTSMGNLQKNPPMPYCLTNLLHIEVPDLLW
jgi:hypothetical protein